MITGFLKNNNMKLSTGSGDNVGRISARRAWIPLKKGKAELMVHEIAVHCIYVTERVRFGLTKFDHKKNKGSWFWERTCSCARVCTNTGLLVPAWAVLALLLALATDRTGCVPTWVVLKDGCRA